MSTTPVHPTLLSRLSALVMVAIAAGSCGGREEAPRPGISSEDQAITLPTERAARTTFSLKAGTKMTFSDTVNGTEGTVTCTHFSASAPTPTGTTLTLAKPPEISGCSDSFGGTSTIATNDTHGKWKVAETEDSTWMTLTVPEGGMVFTTTSLQGCTITGAPHAKDVLNDLYDSTAAWTGTYSIDGLSLKVTGAGCTPGATMTVTATIDVKQ